VEQAEHTESPGWDGIGDLPVVGHGSDSSVLPPRAGRATFTRVNDVRVAPDRAVVCHPRGVTLAVQPPDDDGATLAPANADGAVRIRVGVVLILVSWLPIAWLISASSELRAVIWGVQIVIGLIGVAIAGRETIRIAKSKGWRNSPRAVWALLRSPNTTVDP
jgi:hypothetical protein